MIHFISRTTPFNNGFLLIRQKGRRGIKTVGTGGLCTLPTAPSRPPNHLDSSDFYSLEIQDVPMDLVPPAAFHATCVEGLCGKREENISSLSILESST